MAAPAVGDQLRGRFPAFCEPCNDGATGSTIGPSASEILRSSGTKNPAELSPGGISGVIRLVLGIGLAGLFLNALAYQASGGGK